MLQPSVVLDVSATWSGSAPTSDASARAHLLAQLQHPQEVRHPAAALVEVALELAPAPPRWSHGEIGPNVPALRYAIRSSTGNCARASSKVTGTALLGLAVRHACAPRAQPRRRADAVPDVRATRPAPLGLAPDARRHRRPSRLHAAVRPALAAALVRQGVDVGLLTSRFRYGAVPAAAGYTVDDSLYGLSTGIGSRPGRLAAKALGHPRALLRLAAADCDVLHLQWVAVPEADAWLLRTRRPLVFTAHDLLPRRTARHTRTWKRLFGRFDRVVTHSERGSRTLAEFGVPAGEAARDPASRLPQRSGPGATTAAPSSRSG